MTFNISEYLKKLNLSQTEAAELLSVNPRTVRRWIEYPEEIPGPAIQAFKSWLLLQKNNLAWKPNSETFIKDDTNDIAEQIALHRNHALELSTLMDKVKKRGGPAFPWKVDLKKHQATLGPITVSFYALRNGGFSPSFYTRRDCSPDLVRDKLLIEDAFFCIAEAVGRAGTKWAHES